ncbi:MAG: NfeD family protein [Rhodospirillales bacterium]|nr:NfeD family protein [Rhodospirillales bacterium]
MTPEFSFWHWWALALALAVIEIFAPGASFLWLALAAALVGAVMFVAPDLPWQIQTVVFAGAAVASIVLWLAFRRRPSRTDQPALNRRAEQYLNRKVALESAIVNGFGRLRIDDTIWRIEGPDLPAGTSVVIVGIDGTTLKVEKSAA